jgi:hypothetical protein
LGSDQLLAAATAKVQIWRGIYGIGVVTYIGAPGRKTCRDPENIFYA